MCQEGKTKDERSVCEAIAWVYRMDRDTACKRDRYVECPGEGHGGMRDEDERKAGPGPA